MTTGRQGHVSPDLASRRLKGLKIERLLGLVPDSTPRDLLEIGCGSGGISHYFATHAQLKFNVEAVDVTDSRKVGDGYRFQQVAGTGLPFGDRSFDVVLSNHVIEHVGECAEQLDHLREIHRVLRDEGACYLAVPNRWMLVEPHYKLAFLSWLTPALRSPYLRMAGKGDFYDCVPLAMSEVERMLREVGFTYRNVCVDALRETLSIEQPKGAARFLRHVPGSLWSMVRPVIPTLIYVVTKAPAFRRHT
ncbi:methyltransferase domain-containing protein [Luteibacter sp.]|jgi:SAM-dependent methyltransferase|uniref:methyltransferase domain-containing protein n=1 Tax=Luteibacter sp. TaxID=1886636 RepID=UPI002F40CF40